MDFDFRLGLIAFLGAAWFYLLSAIIDLTTHHKGEAGVIVLAFLHFIVFAYLFLSLYSFYGAGMQHFGARPIVGLDGVDHLLFGTWPFAFMAFTLAFLATKLGFRNEFEVFLGVFGAACLAGMAFIGWRAARISDSVARYVMLLGLGIPFGGFLYIGVLSIVCADVEITTDKEFYSSDESIMACVQTGGYVFAPTVTKVEFNGFLADKPRSETFLIPAQNRITTSYLIVDYRAQTVPINFTRGHFVKIPMK